MLILTGSKLQDSIDFNPVCNKPDTRVTEDLCSEFLDKWNQVNEIVQKNYP